MVPIVLCAWTDMRKYPVDGMEHQYVTDFEEAIGCLTKEANRGSCAEKINMTD